MDAGWEVVTVDTNVKFAPTIWMDVRILKAEEIERVTKLRSFKLYEKVVVLASPPCERFSIANSNWPQKGIRRALDIVGAVIELIIDIQPDYYCIENPKGRLRWFLGAPPHSVKLSDYGHTLSTQGGKMRKPYKPTDLWTNIPFPLLKEIKTMDAKRGGTGFTEIARAERAKMPYGLSQAIIEAVQTTES